MLFTINLTPSFFHHKFRAKFHVVCYIFFFFFFTDDSNSNPAARNPIFLPFHYSPPLLPSSFNRVEIIVFNIPFLLPLYAPMVDISDKTREPCLILTEERERVREKARDRIFLRASRCRIDLPMKTRENERNG